MVYTSTKNGSSAATLLKLQERVMRIAHLVQRVANKRHRLKEHETIKIIQALIIIRITYGTPYLDLKIAEIKTEHPHMKGHQNCHRNL